VAQTLLSVLVRLGTAKNIDALLAFELGLAMNVVAEPVQAK
jgi:hypothetical protein